MQQIKLKELQNKLSKSDYELMRRSVVLKCMITNACWSNWMLEKSVPERKYQPIIDEIAAQFGLVVFGKEGGQQ